MARNDIESDFQTSKMATGKKIFCIDLKWPELRSKVNFGNPRWPIDLKWPEMRSKVNFGQPKWPPAAILSKISPKNKVAYRSEMARNAIETEFRTSKMADVSHFVKKNYKKSVRNVIQSEFRTSKMADGSHFVKKI